MTRKQKTQSKAKPAPKAAAASPSPWSSAGEREQQRELKRDAVIRAAARAFQERGYHNTSLDEVATLLHVTKPTIYRYVTNKEQLLFECFRTGLQRILVALEASASSTATGSARERLLSVVSRYADAITSEFGWCMVRAEDQDLSPAMGEQIKGLKSKIDQGLRSLIKQGIKDGSIGDVDPKMTAFAIAGALNWIAHWYRSSDSLTPEQIAARYVELFDQGLRPRAKR